MYGRLFHGERRADGAHVVVMYREDGKSDLLYDLPLRLDVVNHSPTGFEWGYGGSGPAQLAVALLCEVLEAHNVPEATCRAMWLHQQLKADLVCGFPDDGWSLAERDLIAWVRENGDAELCAALPEPRILNE